MTLKSYRLKVKSKTKKKMKSAGGLITAGITALVGTALVAQTASVLRRL